MVAIMRAMKSSGNGWIGDIPAEWNTSRVGLYFTVILGKMLCTQPLSADYTLEPYFCAADVHFDGINGDNLKQMWFSTAEKGQYSVGVGDLLIVEGGAGAGGCAVVDALSQDTYVQNSIMIVRPNDDAGDNRFLKYWIEYLVRSGYMDYICNIATIPHFTKEKVGGVPLVLPSDQHVIADFLDAKCTEIDALSADIQSEIEMLEAYKRSVIAEAVTKGLDKNVSMKTSETDWIGDIPVSWQMMRGKYIFAQRNEKGNSICAQLLSPTQKYGVIPQDSYEELTGASAVKLKDSVDLNTLKTIHKGDYCISLRSFQGGFEYSEYEGVVSPAYQVFFPVIPIADGYYKYLFKVKNFIDKMNSFALSLRDGKNIAFADFARTYIPLPPVEEQKRIAEFLDYMCAEIDSIIAQKQEQLAVLADYKKSVIYEYVTGKKEVPAI